ncbi:WXG100-like domain-containing protein [Nocardia jiangsuensis]|uniref:Outer membrane channel protein CpnT-like N-terminal domain-containing protein n=1 Tax=Nocardia jiangsuensis TaxID=1691563 RepID=A0ABV8DX25_9NOCA
MALHIPPALEWLEWVAGGDWPHGNEDSMWEMSRELRAIGAEVEQLLGELDGATRTTLAVYPAGEGRDGMADFLHGLRSGDGSLEQLAANYVALADSADQMGDQLQAAKLNVIAGLVLLAAELAYALFLGPGAPFAQAGAIAATQAAFRWLGMRLLGYIERLVGRMITNQVARTITTRLVYEITQEAIVEALQGAAQEFTVQAIQVGGGHRDGFDWGQIGLNTGISAVAGGAAGPAGHLLGRALPGALPGVFRGAVTGAGAGAVGAGAGWVATGVATGNWEFDPRMLTGGVIGGMGPSAVYGARGLSDFSGAPMPAPGSSSAPVAAAAPGAPPPGMSPASGQSPVGDGAATVAPGGGGDSSAQAGGGGGGSRGGSGAAARDGADVDSGSRGGESGSHGDRAGGADNRAGDGGGVEGNAAGSADGAPGAGTAAGESGGRAGDGTSETGTRTGDGTHAGNSEAGTRTGDGTHAGNSEAGTRAGDGTHAGDGEAGARTAEGDRGAAEVGARTADGASDGRADGAARAADSGRFTGDGTAAHPGSTVTTAGATPVPGSPSATAPPNASAAPGSSLPSATSSPSASPPGSHSSATTTPANASAPRSTPSASAAPANTGPPGSNPSAGSPGGGTAPSGPGTTPAAQASTPDRPGGTPITGAQPAARSRAADATGSDPAPQRESRAGAAAAALPALPIDATSTGSEAPQRVQNHATPDVITPMLLPDTPPPRPRPTTAAGNGDGSVPHRTPDTPTSDDTRTPGNCVPSALTVAAARTEPGTVSVPDPPGPGGLDAETVEQHAGTRMREATSHDQVVADLRALGDGATVVVVDEYPGPANEYDVGAHAYTLTLDDGVVTVHDDALPGGARPLAEHTPAHPVSRILVLAYNAKGHPLHPVGTHPHEVGPLARIGEPGPPGVVAAVGAAHGAARSGDRLTDADILARVIPDLRLVTPGELIWNRGDNVFELPGRAPRRTIRLLAGPVPDDHLATYHARPDGTGYDVVLSTGTRDADITRTVANALAAIQQVEHGADPGRAGRSAELRVLASAVDRAAADPNQAGELAARRAALTEHIDHLDDLDALAATDPALAQRIRLEQREALALRPQFSPDLTDTDFDTGTAEHLNRLEQHLDGEYTDSILAAEQLGLAGRMHEELARRIFDPVFDRSTAAARAPIRPALDAVLAPITTAINAPALDPAQRAAALHDAIDALATSTTPELRAVLDVAAMHRAADAFAAAPTRIGAVLDRANGTVRLEQELPGRPRGTELSFRDLLHLIDEANRGAAANGIDLDYVLVVHDPTGDHSTLQLLSRPRPQHRLPLHQNLRHTDGAPFEPDPLPSARAAAAGGHTVDVGVGRSAFAAELTPDADRAGGGLVIQTELTGDYTGAGQRRRDLGVLDPGALPLPGVVTVYADLLGAGRFLNVGGNGGIGRIFVNNVSAHLGAADYDALARALPAALAPGARIEVQWDMKSEQADDSGYAGDRGHIQADLLLQALRRVNPPAIADAFHIVQTQVFDGQGNENYLYSIDAGVRNVMNAAAMARFAAPIPDHRMVIAYEPESRITDLTGAGDRRYSAAEHAYRPRDGVLRPGRTAPDAVPTPNDLGRILELGLLADQAERVAADPEARARTRWESLLLVEATGLREGTLDAAQRRQLVTSRLPEVSRGRVEALLADVARAESLLTPGDRQLVADARSAIRAARALDFVSLRFHGAVLRAHHTFGAQAEAGGFPARAAEGNLIEEDGARWYRWPPNAEVTLTAGPPTEPAAVHEEWSRLSPAERDDRYRTDPYLGNRDGIPHADRNRYNRQTLARLRADAVQRNDETRLRVIDDMLGMLNNSGEHLLSYLDAELRYIYALGDPDTARNVVVELAGAFRRRSGVGYAEQTLAQLRQAAAAVDPEATTAVLLFGAYDNPNSLNAALGSVAAEEGAPAVRRFHDGLRVTHRGPRPHITTIAHSYGGVAGGHAAGHGHALNTDALVFVGSWGTGVPHVGELRLTGVAPAEIGAHVFATMARYDSILLMPRTHGPPPATPSFGATVFESGSRPSDTGAGWNPDDHVAPNYLDSGHPAYQAIGLIVTGLGHLLR